MDFSFIVLIITILLDLVLRFSATSNHFLIIQSLYGSRLLIYMASMSTKTFIYLSGASTRCRRCIHA